MDQNFRMKDKTVSSKAISNAIRVWILDFGPNLREIFRTGDWVAKERDGICGIRFNYQVPSVNLAHHSKTMQHSSKPNEVDGARLDEEKPRMKRSWWSRITQPQPIDGLLLLIAASQLREKKPSSGGRQLNAEIRATGKPPMFNRPNFSLQVRYIAIWVSIEIYCWLKTVVFLVNHIRSRVILHPIYDDCGHVCWG